MKIYRMLFPEWKQKTSQFFALVGILTAFADLVFGITYGSYFFVGAMVISYLLQSSALKDWLVIAAMSNTSRIEVLEKSVGIVHANTEKVVSRVEI